MSNDVKREFLTGPRKITKVHHGKVNLKRSSQKNLRVWRYLRKNGVLAQKEQNHQVVKASAPKAKHPRLCRRRRRRAGDWRAEPFIPTKLRRSPAGHSRKSPLWSTREQRRTYCRRARFPEYPQRKRKYRIMRGFTGLGGEHIMDSRSSPSELLRRKSKWQVADVRRLPVSASHIIQAGNDFVHRKGEAYITNRKKKEKSMVRQEGNVVCA